MRVAPLLIPGHNFHSTNHWGAMATSCSVALLLWKCKNNLAKTQTQKIQIKEIIHGYMLLLWKVPSQKGIQICKFQSRLLNRWNCWQKKSLSENWDMRSSIALIVIFLFQNQTCDVYYCSFWYYCIGEMDDVSYNSQW